MSTSSQKRNTVRYYIELLTQEVKDLCYLVHFIERRRAEGRVYTKQSRFGHGTNPKDPCAMIRKFKSEFANLQRQVDAKDFVEEYQTDMENILTIWQTWKNPEDEYSYLQKQDDFQPAIERNEVYFSGWYDGDTLSGLKQQLFLSTHDTWTLLPTAVMPNQSDVTDSSGSLTHQLLTRLKNI